MEGRANIIQFWLSRPLREGRNLFGGFHSPDAVMDFLA